MKILVVAPDVDMTEIKGDTVHLKNVLKKWNEEYEVHLISGTPNGELPIELSRHSSVAASGSGKGETLVRLGKSAITTVKTALFDDYDVIYERHHVFGTATLGAKLSGTQHATEINGILTREHIIRGTLPPKAVRILKPTERFTLSQSDSLVCVSPKVRDYLETEFGIPTERIHVVPNGVDAETFHPVSEARQKLDWEEERTYVGFVGALQPWQGNDQLLRGIAMLSARDVTGVFIGEGPERAKLERLAIELGIEEDIQFTGYVPNDDVPTYLSACDIGAVLKSPAKPGSPLKLFEYLACGTPVIATDDEDFVLIDEHDVGTLVEHDNPEAVADGIEWLLSQNSKRMSRRAREFAETRTWAKVSQEALGAALERTRSRDTSVIGPTQ